MAPTLRDPKVAEVVVLADVVSAALVEPAARLVVRTRVIDLGELGGHVICAELPPSLVEDGPRGDAREEAEVLDGGAGLLEPCGAGLRVGGAKSLELLRVVEMPGDFRRHGGNLARVERWVFCRPSVDHVLPHDHAQTVAVIVPARRLDLEMLAQHVEAELAGRLDVVEQCLVARCGK